MAVPVADFSWLGQLPLVADQAAERQRQQGIMAARAQTLASLGQAGGNVDYNGIAQRLFQAGDMEGAMSLAKLGTHQADTAYSHQRDTIQDQWQREQAQRAQSNTDRSFGLQKDQATLQREIATRKEVPGGFMVVPGGGLQPVPGGPADPRYLKAKTDAEAKAKGNELGADVRKDILTAEDAMIASRNAVDSLKTAIDLNGKTYSGAGADTRANIVANVPGLATQAANDTLNLKNIMQGQVLGALKTTFGGNPTEGERKILLDVEGAINAPAPVRKQVLERALERAQQRVAIHEGRAKSLRSGSYFAEGGGVAAPAGGRPVPTVPEADIAKANAVPSAANFAVTKTINGKTFGRIGDDWYEVAP